MRRLTTLIAGSVLLATGPVLADQGISPTEIVIGTHTALTGPVAPWGIGSTNGIRMRFDEENDKGGIYGRKIKYIVEDHGYQVPRAVQAGNKLLNSDKIMLMVGALGTPMNNAVFQQQLALGVPNLGPFTAARSMYHPFHKLKFATLSSYYDQTRAGFKYFAEKKGMKTPCVMYEDNDFGQEILEAVRDEAKVMNIKVAAESGHKPTDTELGWNAAFVGTSAAYENVVATAQGGITEGFYTLNGQEVIYADQVESPEAKAFFDKYKAKYNVDPFYPAQLGYGIGDLVVGALKEAGKDLTTEKFLKAFESIKDRVGPVGGPPITFTATQHLGSNLVFLGVVEKGRWKSVERNLKY
jgi:branched-chain amino acid transport system substrate-binding protein